MWSLNSILKVRRTEKELTSNLYHWRESRIEGFSLIEMKVLERTIQQFNDEEPKKVIDWI